MIQLRKAIVRRESLESDKLDGDTGDSWRQRVSRAACREQRAFSARLCPDALRHHRFSSAASLSLLSPSELRPLDGRSHRPSRRGLSSSTHDKNWTNVDYG